MALRDFEVRPTQPSDAQNLNELYHLLTGIRRSSQQFAWEWLNGYAGPAPSWVIVEKSSNRLAGHHGVVPVPLTYDGENLRAARTENTMVHPEFRGKFPYHVVEAQLLKDLLERYDAIFTTAGKGPQLAVRKRLGYYEVGKWRTNRLVSTAAYLARRLVGAISKAKPVATAIKPKSYSNLTITSLGFSEFEQALSQMPIVIGGVDVAGNPEFFRWRLAQHPYAKRETCAFSIDEVSGLAAWRAEMRSGAVSVHLEHFACDSDDAEKWSQALKAICASLARAAPVAVSLRCVANGGFLDTVVSQATRSKVQTESNDEAARLLVRSNRISPTAIWNATPMMTQGI